MNTLFLQVKNFFKEPRYKQMREVFWFVVITLAIHYSYRFWANTLNYWPIQAWMNELQQTMAGWIFTQSTWLDQHVLHISYQSSGQMIQFGNGSRIAINSSCAGDKQILQFLLLLLIYPGSWKHKSWYIPLGMLVIYCTNLLRIVLVSTVAVNIPKWLVVAHDTVLRGMFYAVIFFLWLIWVRVINSKEVNP